MKKEELVELLLRLDEDSTAVSFLRRAGEGEAETIVSLRQVREAMFEVFLGVLRGASKDTPTPTPSQSEASERQDMAHQNPPSTPYKDDFPDLKGHAWEVAMNGAGHNVNSHLRELGPCDACGVDWQGNRFIKVV